MNFFFFRHPGKKGKDETVKNFPVAIREPLYNIREGGKTPDDAIRTHDLPIIRTEESIAAGSPENLL